MPRLKSVKRLTESCMNFILENQEYFCKRFKPRKPEDGVDALDSDQPAVNSFDYLPTELLEELIRLLREKEKKIFRTHRITPLFKLLMTPRLRTLDLTVIETGNDISDVLYLATIRCPNLETLCFDSSTRQYMGNFYFISKFEKLQILDISYCVADDDCLNLIGSHCPDLRELYVKFGKVTDDGIQKLCVVGNCKSIRKLILERCGKITTKGIQMALDNLPQLRVLCHESLLECLAEIAQSATDKNLAFPKYHLSALYILEQTVYKSGSLRQSVLLCPNVTEVYLTIWMKEGLKDTELSSLLSLENLYTIEITHAAILETLPTGAARIDRDLSFDGIVPLLKKFGYHLKRLMIGCFFVVDIPVVIQFCPNLESLVLDNCKTTQSGRTEVKRPRLQKLKQLILTGYYTISLDNLLTLLSSPLLSYLSIVKCDILTDNVLHRVSNLNGFRNLECLNLYHCDSLSKNGIDFFLKESNPLSEIVLYSNLVWGSRITQEDIFDWNDNAIWIKKNWQLNFIFKRLHKNIYLGGHIWGKGDTGL